MNSRGETSACTRPLPGRHPLHAARADHAFVAGAVAVRQLAVEDEGDGLEAAVRMRAERQAAVVRRIDLRAVVVQEQEGIDLRRCAGPAPDAG